MGFWRLHKAHSPFFASDLAEVDFVQSANEITFVHLDYAPRKLVRTDHTDWAFSTITFGAAISPPANVAGSASQPNATGAIATTYTYYVTATDANGQESIASAPNTETNDLSLPGNYNTITWDAVADASFYTVYKGDNSAPGYVGMVQAPTLSFKDRNLQSVASDTPPLATNPFSSADNYPSSVTFHQGRQIFGRTRNRPNAIWGSQPAAPENMDVSRPARPDDALSFALVTEKVNSANQLVSMGKDLIVLGGDSIFSVTGGEGGALTPAAIEPKRETGRGSSRLQPIVIDSVVFYQSERSEGVRALGFTFETEGYKSNNVAIFSPHFFLARRIVSWAYQEEPYSCIWTALDDGTLLCFTWEEEQEVWGWTMMEIDGLVEQVQVVHENGYDRLYALIRRTIAGVERRFHERLALPHFDDITTACHLDCAVTQVSAEPSDTIDQLWHLEGETVSAVYDGYVEHGLTVENGSVTLPEPAYIRTAGLRYTGIIETLPLVLDGNDTDRQSFGDIVVRALETRGLEISTDDTLFDPLPERDGIDTAQLPESDVRDFPAVAPGNWTDGSTLIIRQQEPLPAHIAAVFIEVALGESRER
jgi:hypothetical protein